MSHRDAAELFRISALPRVARFTNHHTSMTFEAFERRVFTEDPNRHALVLERADGAAGGDVPPRLVGAAGLAVGAGPRVRHTAMFWVSIDDAFHGLGFGELVSRAVLRIADEELGLRRVWLETNFDNGRGIALYQRLGFVEEGRLRGNTLREGTYIDSILMARLRPAPPLLPPSDGTPRPRRRA